ncbi:beta-ketoacyl-[acyl-carrier-protein] synthase family protein [Thermogutta sp.]|jgi:3-oxoacyl-[acyl-carrier-protein] synthase II|uniref:beta-ketoacyl-[acyl-carrier-protein] synthase family protein n=1 Tax=Thermogutta sp. TaxID=1962930 RepID=UPI003220382D
MLSTDIVITGIGIVSPIGTGVEAFTESLLAGRSGVERIRLFDPSGLPVRSAAEIKDFDPRRFVPNRKALKVMARDAQLGVAAAMLAWKSGGLETAGLDPDRVGVVLGADRICGALEDSEPTYRACMVDGHFDFDRWAPMGMPATFPLVFLKVLPNMVASHISIVLDARGPNNTIHQGDLSGLLAVIEGASLLERNLADVVLVGGASSQMNPFDWARFGVIGRLSKLADDGVGSPRPFDRDRDGEVRGEAAVLFVLEREHHARARGARIWAHLRGWGRCCVYQRSHVDQRLPALEKAIRLALKDAELQPREIGHVNAQGVATRVDDILESRAIEAALGDIPVTAPRSFFGNTGAAAGALELAATIVLGPHQLLPPTLHYEHPDPECPVNVVSQPQKPSSNLNVAVNWTPVGQAAALVVETNP